MDPLSIIASSIAIATLAAKTCDAFSTLRGIAKTLPGRMHALNNEVADLELVLHEVATAFKERQDLLVDDHDKEKIPVLLRHVRAKLLELKAIIERFTESAGRPNSKVSSFFTAREFNKEQPRLARIQEEIKSVKCSLNILLGASNSRDMVRIRVELEALSTATSQIPEDQNTLRDELINSLMMNHGTLMNFMDSRINQIEDKLRVQSESIERNQTMQMGVVHRPPARRRRPPSPIPQNVDNSSVASQGIGVRVNQYSFKCRPGCGCSCHKQKKSNTSSFMNRVLGQFFIGYAGLPMVSPKCDSAECEKAQIPVFQLSYRSNTGPQVSLSMLRSVPDTAPCVEFALHGNIEGLRSLFRRGMASPLDVSVTRGYTLVRWALYGKQYQTVKFLVQEGGDADYRPRSPYDNSPRNKASDIVLQGGLARSDEEALHCLTQGSDWIDDQNFSKIHKIVCGLSLESLDEALLADPESIDTRDALGRTPLLWAAARGDAKSAVTLLSHGADPNILDNQLAPPVSYAADRGHAVCVRLLLEAGAETDPVLPNGYIGGSALNCAARNATDPLVLKTLLDFGADTESAGVDGRTCLIHVARTDNASFAMLLLEYGADLNAISASNQTPLTTAIINNSHNVLRLLLERWSEYSECPRLKGPHLLQVAALYGDVETLHILAQTDHFRLMYDKDYSLGDFAERLKDRHDVSEKLILAFEELLAVINTEPKHVPDEHDLMEKGLWSWHTSRVGSACGSDLSKAPPKYSVAYSIDSQSTSSYTFEDALERVDNSDAEGAELETEKDTEAQYGVNLNLT